MSKRYRTKPVEIVEVEAIQFLGDIKTFEEIRIWVGDNSFYDYQESPTVRLGQDGVNKNDWIVRKKFDFSVMSDSDFRKIYKIVE